MGDTEVWLKHARRKETCGVASDTSSEPQDVHYAPFGGSNRILFVAKLVHLSEREVRMNCQFIKYMCRLYRGRTPSNCLRLNVKRSDSPVFQLDTGTVLLDWQVRTCAIRNDG